MAIEVKSISNVSTYFKFYQPLPAYIKTYPDLWTHGDIVKKHITSINSWQHIKRYINFYQFTVTGNKPAHGDITRDVSDSTNSRRYIKIWTTSTHGGTHDIPSPQGQTPGHAFHSVVLNNKIWKEIQCMDQSYGSVSVASKSTSRNIKDTALFSVNASTKRDKEKAARIFLNFPFPKWASD